MSFIRFMSTPAGRTVRVVTGIALVAAGLAAGGPAGWALAAFGLLPVATGAANICPVCPLLDDAHRSAAGCSGSSCS